MQGGAGFETEVEVEGEVEREQRWASVKERARRPHDSSMAISHGRSCASLSARKTSASRSTPAMR